MAHPGVDEASDLITEHLVREVGAAVGLTNPACKNIISMRTVGNLGWRNIDAAA